MTVKLRPEIEARLRDQAQRARMAPDAYAASLIERGLGPEPPEDATLALLDQWDAEEATDDPKEIARQQREAEEFMQSLARSRVEMEGPNARKLWP